MGEWHRCRTPLQASPCRGRRFAAQGRLLRSPGRLLCRSIVPLAFGSTLLLSSALPLLAGSVTAESVMGRRNALDRAMEQIPRGSRVTRKRCEEISVGMGNYRDRCTVWYEKEPEAAEP